MMNFPALRQRAGFVALAWGSVLSAPASAVGDLAGGPGVNQYSLNVPNSQIAVDQVCCTTSCW